MHIIERIQGDPNEETREFLAGRINAMRRELGKPETDWIRNKSSFAKLVTAYGMELAEYERAVRFGTRMAEWWIIDLQVENELDLIEIESRIERLANQAEMLAVKFEQKEKEMATGKGKKDKGNPKKKDQKAPEPAAAEETMPEPEAEVTPEPQDEETQVTMTDRRAVEILFAVTMKEEDRPKVDDFTDTQCAAELKENVGLLGPEDRKTIMEQFPEDGEAAWSHFQALRADLAGKEAKEDKKAGKAAGKAKKDKAPAAEKPSKEKKKDSVPAPAGEKRKGPPPKFTERDEYGFGIGSANHEFIEFLKSGPKSMKECKDAAWNKGGGTFYNAFNQLVKEGKAEKTSDGKMQLKKAA